VNDPLAPTTVPVVVVPSPQSMVAVKLPAVSVAVPSVKLATSVVVGSAVPSVAVTRSNWPDRLFAIMASLAPAKGRRLSAAAPSQGIIAIR
jgi:hypothetical protein